MRSGSPLRALPLRRVARAQGAAAFRAWVERSSDRRLERTVGTKAGLHVLFAAVQRSFAPDQAAGFTGELGCELRTTAGELRCWALEIAPHGAALVRPGAALDPRLTVKLTVADLVRIAAGELDAGEALLTGRMDLQGDVTVAMRLGEMFGRGERPRRRAQRG